MAETLTEAAVRIVRISDPFQKAEISTAVAQQWQRGEIKNIGTSQLVDSPGRPEKPVLLPPQEMPRRRAGGTPHRRLTLLHALAHIELNAINLAWDLISRFAENKPEWPHQFFDDWVKVAAEEARHLLMLSHRLIELGSTYGALPAHDGLWQTAAITDDDALARLAIVPLVLEARGLDVTPVMITQLSSAGDTISAQVLQRILDDEIGHVAIGKVWFDWLCKQRGLDPIHHFQSLVRARFIGRVKPPFNQEARQSAFFEAAYYEILQYD